jgi:hypothetical protein
MGRAVLRLLYSLGMEGTALDPARPWTKTHAAPPLPDKSFRALWGKRNDGN